MAQYGTNATTAGMAGNTAGAYPATTTGFATDVQQTHTTHTTAMPAVQTRGQKVHTSAKPFALLPLLGLAFAGWAIYLGGLAAMQNVCGSSDGIRTIDTDGDGVADTPVAVGSNGFNTAYLNGVSGFSSSVLPCSKVYRWSWFCMAFEIVIILGLLISTLMGRLWHARLAFLALFAVGTLLFMLQTERFLTVPSINTLPGYEGGSWGKRAWTTFAGALIIVVANILIILAIGIDRLVDHTGQATEGYGHGHANKV